MTFYDRMQQLLSEKNMTAADLSRVILITPPSINGWKNGSLPRADIACKVAKALNTTVEYLVTGEVEEVPKDIIDLAYEISSLPKVFRDSITGSVELFKSQLSEQGMEKISDAG